MTGQFVRKKQFLSAIVLGAFSRSRTTLCCFRPLQNVPRVRGTLRNLVERFGRLGMNLGKDVGRLYCSVWNENEPEKINGLTNGNDERVSPGGTESALILTRHFFEIRIRDADLSPRNGYLSARPPVPRRTCFARN